MAWRCGSLSRSLLSTARASSSVRSSPSLTRLRPPSLNANRLRSPLQVFSNARNLGELGCMQSLLPLHSAVTVTCLTSHLVVEARACCELSQGT
ncbi:protein NONRESPONDING TO OXYLIPINS 2, mitochondrial-like isoform X2 [Malania oleifera]|nr:protein NONRESPONDING TO OXYLIPINS 2, mitochondrial-like isoform X2 [Malania oleifera]